MISHNFFAQFLFQMLNIVGTNNFIIHLTNNNEKLYFEGNTCDIQQMLLWKKTLKLEDQLFSYKFQVKGQIMSPNRLCLRFNAMLSRLVARGIEQCNKFNWIIALMTEYRSSKAELCMVHTASNLIKAIDSLCKQN